MSQASSTVSRVIPFSSKHSIEISFRNALAQHRRSPSLAGYNALLGDLSVARMVCDSEVLRDLQDAALWDQCVLVQEISRVDVGVAEYEESIA